jgi:uncharacterized protein YjiK
MKLLFINIFFAFFFIAAGSQANNKNESGPEKKDVVIINTIDTTHTYNLSTPDKVWEMPPQLREISGICFNKEGKMLCEQDQKGEIFVYDLQTGSIEKVIKFSGKGDFEDIAYKNETVFILRSDGIIFCVENYLSPNPVTTQITTFLHADNNTEGLVYDSENDRLLVACKGNSGIKAAHKRTKAVYAVTLTNKKMENNPVFVISKKDMKNVFNDDIEIDPSAIAINPLTKNIFMLGTRGVKVLIELSPNGKLLHVNKLTNPLFIQPEGMTFDKNGDMYISNEGKEKKGNILLFRHKN